MSAFNIVYERRQSNSVKWDSLHDVYNVRDTSDLLAMWIADMDFTPPPAVIEALTRRLQHPIFGYSVIPNTLKSAVVQWYERRHHWQIDQNTILFRQSVVSAIADVVATMTTKGDYVAISTPVYPPFFQIPHNLERALIKCPLVERNGHYIMDFDALRLAFDKAKLFILCNPHNPAGIVWSKQDLERLVELAIEFNVTILSDEIHADILLDGESYTPLLTVARTDEANIIACISPTKTFNIAGIQASMMVIPNKTTFNELKSYGVAHGQVEYNTFAIAAVEAAYSSGEQWLDELLIYISKNADYVIAQLTKIPGIQVQKPQATYLLWIDYRQTGLCEEEIMQQLLQHNLALDPGTKYGEHGDGFLRMNIATPFSMVEEAVSRFEQAINQTIKYFSSPSNM